MVAATGTGTGTGTTGTLLILVRSGGGFGLRWSFLKAALRVGHHRVQFVVDMLQQFHRILPL